MPAPPKWAPLPTTETMKNTATTPHSPPQTPEERIADLKRKRRRLSRYLDENESDVDPLTYAKLVEMLSRLDGRIIQHEKHLAASQGPDGASKHDLDQALETFWQTVDDLRDPATD